MIGKKRQDRLWKHLMEVEEQIGSPLRLDPRGEWDCPISNCAPDRDKDSRNFVAAGLVLHYSHKNYPCVYDVSDSRWWGSLSIKTKEQVTKWVTKKLAER